MGDQGVFDSRKNRIEHRIQGECVCAYRKGLQDAHGEKTQFLQLRQRIRNELGGLSNELLVPVVMLWHVIAGRCRPVRRLQEEPKSGVFVGGKKDDERRLHQLDDFVKSFLFRQFECNFHWHRAGGAGNAHRSLEEEPLFRLRVSIAISQKGDFTNVIANVLPTTVAARTTIDGAPVNAIDVAKEQQRASGQRLEAIPDLLHRSLRGDLCMVEGKHEHRLARSGEASFDSTRTNVPLDSEMLLARMDFWRCSKCVDRLEANAELADLVEFVVLRPFENVRNTPHVLFVKYLAVVSDFETVTMKLECDRPRKFALGRGFGTAKQGIFGVLQKFVNEMRAVAVQLSGEQFADVVELFTATPNIVLRNTLIIARHGESSRMMLVAEHRQAWALEV